MRRFILRIAALPVCMALFLNAGAHISGNSVTESHTACAISRADNNRMENAAGLPLLENASVETSAMCFWEYNNNTAECCWLFDKDGEQEIVDYINGIKPGDVVKSVDTDKLKGNMYGLEIGSKEGAFIGFIWYGGYIFLDDGRIYKADIDFARIKDYQWQEKNKMPLTLFPNIRCIALKNGKWNTKFLVKSKKNQPHGLEITSVKIKGTKLEVKLKNKKKKENYYSEYFSVQAKLDGVWYDIPVKDDMAFNDIAYIIKAGGKVKKSYDLTPYGKLPSGRYRIVAEGASAEFNL
ncbi:MAG: hypothetical protein HFH68_00085 [Lachnospiraceae bacterium]|nr:hypothetical protein [Lachnospiraceae bacterium]